MEWPERLNLAIEYIEESLVGDLDLNEAAAVACCSRYHFHRVFFGAFGVTPGEYVRRRKLTLAAAELSTGTDRVLTIALKYGYDSPNAFTRAFRRLHGVNPSKIQSSQAKLSAYKRLAYSMRNQGEDKLDYRIVERPAFRLVGKGQDFELEKFFKDGPRFWKKYVQSEEYKALWALTQGRPGPISGSPLMSTFFPRENGDCSSFTDVLGLEAPPELDCSQFDTYTVPAAVYAEFGCLYKTSVKTNRYIYGDWFASTGYERDGAKPDIAAYFPAAFRPVLEMGVRWWIPVVKKS